MNQYSYRATVVCAVAVAVIAATYITGNPYCLWGFAVLLFIG